MQDAKVHLSFSAVLWLGEVKERIVVFLWHLRRAPPAAPQGRRKVSSAQVALYGSGQSITRGRTHPSNLAARTTELCFTAYILLTYCIPFQTTGTTHPKQYHHLLVTVQSHLKVSCDTTLTHQILSPAMVLRVARHIGWRWDPPPPGPQLHLGLLSPLLSPPLETTSPSGITWHARLASPDSPVHPPRPGVQEQRPGHAD